MSRKSPVADPKIQALREHRTLNPHPEGVHDELFLAHDFFDPRDLLQIKYEMLRLVSVEKRPIHEAAKAFGFSRPAFYSAQAMFKEGGLAGLIPQRRGPRRSHKLSAEVMAFIQQLLVEDASRGARTLVGLIQERFGLNVHPRSIERALARSKKKRLEYSPRKQKRP